MKITFLPSDDTVSAYVPEPKPAAEYMPKWFSEMPIFHGTHEIGSPDFKGISAKGCMSFYDTFRTGYIQETWADLMIDPDKQVALSSREPRVIKVRETPPTIRQPEFEPVEFTWKQPWVPKMPKGYSLLVTHPMNRYDLPFVTTTGIIDADEFFHVFWGNLPFYLKKGFSGVIPAGTPMYQMIPIKRDDWEREVDREFSDADRLKLSTTTRIKFHGVYQKYFHKKKRYV